MRHHALRIVYERTQCQFDDALISHRSRNRSASPSSSKRKHSLPSSSNAGAALWWMFMIAQSAKSGSLRIRVISAVSGNSVITPTTYAHPSPFR